jgi:hypothetical protein
MAHPNAWERPAQDDEGTPHRAARVAMACAQKRMASHRIVTRSSPHTSLTAPPLPAEYPPQTTSRRRLLRNSFAPRAPPAHPQQPPHSDEPAERGDKGRHLDERDGAVDSQDPSVRERGGRDGGRHVRVVNLEVRARRVGQTKACRCRCSFPTRNHLKREVILERENNEGIDSLKSKVKERSLIR